MYRQHFNLRERPFAHAPGERLFAANAATADAIGHLQQVLTARDAVALLTGGPGVGKSALAAAAATAAAEQIRAVRVDLRYAEAAELHSAVLLALGEATAELPSAVALNELRRAMARLGQDGKRLALLLDVGSLSAEVARQLLRLMNLAGEQDCHLNLILMGPHPLHQQVDVPAMIHLRQRIGFRYRARPLTLAETERYIRYQLPVRRADPANLLTGSVAAAVYCYVAGVPRLVNTLMDATLGETCLQDLERPDSAIVKRSAEGLGWKPMVPNTQAAAAPAQRATPRPAATRPATADGQVPGAARKPEPQVSEITMQLRADAFTGTGPVTLASEAASPTAALFGGETGRAASETTAPVVEMDADDTSATGMLRLQDMDERIAESVFGREAKAGSG